MVWSNTLGLLGVALRVSVVSGIKWNDSSMKRRNSPKAIGENETNITKFIALKLR